MTLICVVGALAVVVALVLRGPPRCDRPESTAPSFVLPPTTLSYGDSDPEVVIALFVDFESPASRQVFATITESVGFGRLGKRSALRLLHAPPGGCAPEDTSYRCVAARAVECAESLTAGAGAPMAGAAFDLQWEAQAMRGLDGLLKRAAALGIDPERLRPCILADVSAQGRIAAHALWARDHGLVAEPAGYVIREGEPGERAVFHAWITRGSLLRVVNCLTDGKCEERRS